MRASFVLMRGNTVLCTIAPFLYKLPVALQRAGEFGAVSVFLNPDIRYLDLL